jgi:hypothetical protein
MERLRKEGRSVFGGGAICVFHLTSSAIATIKLVDSEIGLTEETKIFQLKHKCSNASLFAAG